MNGSRVAGHALLAFTVAACGSDVRAAAETAGTQPIEVRTVAVLEEAVTRPIHATGTLQPKESATLGFRISGVVAAVLVDEGQTVRRGQPLANLDLREIDAQVSRARSGAAKAERDLARIRMLYADSVATLEQMQNATTAFEVATADLQAAEFNRQYATILAPAEGTILRRFVEAGEQLPPGAPVLQVGVAAAGSVLRAGLADRDVVRLELGDRAEVTFDAFPGVQLPARVTQIAAAANPGTGTYTVEIALDRGGPSLVAGLVGRAVITTSEGSLMRTVPIESVVEADGQRAVVFALAADGRTAERREVTVAFVFGDRVAIAAGLDDVGTVITDGAAYLNHGTAVEVVR